MKTRWKIVIGIAGLLGVTIFALWLLGSRTFVTTAEMTIDAPPEKVFRYLTTPTLLPKWMGGVVEITPLTEGGHQVGAKTRVVIEENGRRLPMESEVIRSEEGKLLEVRVTNEMCIASSVYVLEGSGDRTLVKHTMTAEYLGFVRCLAPFLSGDVRQKLDEDLQSLKRVVESE